MPASPKINGFHWRPISSAPVKPEACNPLDPDLPSGSEETIAQRVAAELSALGFDTELLAAEPRRPNVLGRLPGPPGGRSLAFNTHLDTYPALEPEQWTKTDGDPFNPTRHGDWLYARGTSDTRGNLASTLLAARAIVEAGVKLNGELICFYTVNEEKNGPSGSIYLTKEKGFKPDAIIVAEPTAWGAGEADWGMSLSVANSGHCLIELIVQGVKSHLWRPDVALNPIDAAWYWEPNLNKAVNDGGEILIHSGTMAERGYPTWDIGVVMVPFAEKYPDLVKTFLKSECEAVDFWIKDPAHKVRRRTYFSCLRRGGVTGTAAPIYSVCRDLFEERYS